MERPETAGERYRREKSQRLDFGPLCRPRPQGFQGIRSDPRSTGGDGRGHQGFQGRHPLGACAMSRPDPPFPKHWRYYIVVKWAVIAAAVALALKLLGVF